MIDIQDPPVWSEFINEALIVSAQIGMFAIAALVSMVTFAIIFENVM